MKRSLALIALVGLCLGTAPPTTHAAVSGDSAAVTLLLEHASYWNTHGREDLAVQNWKRALQADPNQTRALEGVGLYAAHHGDFAEARGYQARLAATAPNAPATAMIEQLLAVGDAAAPAIARAAKAQEQQRYDEAVAAYQEVFGANPPAAWSDVYYQALQQSQTGDQSQAISSARIQVKNHPNDAGYQLALGRLLIQNADTRTEGIEILEKLAQQGSAESTTAETLWHQGLIYMGDDPKAAPYIRRYLVNHNDLDLRQQLNATTAADASRARAAQAAQAARAADAAARARAPAVVQDTYGPKLAAAYASLKAGHLDDAQAQFSALVTTRPDNAKAHEGLADVAMQRKEFVTAENQYKAAASVSKQARQRRHYEALAEQASYWTWMNAGGQALRANEYSEAMSSYKKALVIRPHDPAALVSLASIYEHEGDAQNASVIYSELAKSKPQDISGWMGLLAALQQLDQSQQILAAVNSMPPKLREKASTRTDFAGIVAGAQTKTGHPQSAILTLGPAITVHPGAASRALRIQMGWLLYDTDQDHALYGKLQELRHESGLTADETNQIRKLYIAAARREMLAADKKGNKRAVNAIVANLTGAYPNDPGVARVQASVLLQQHDYKGAAAIYRRVGPEKTAEGYRAAAGAALAAKENNDALRWANAGLKLDPSNTDLALLSARADVALGHSSRARQTLKAMLQRLPPSATAYGEVAYDPTLSKTYAFADNPATQTATFTDTENRNAAAAIDADAQEYAFAGNRLQAATATAPEMAVYSNISPAKAAIARQKLEAELAVISSRTSPYVGNAVYGSSRTGTDGLDHMTLIADQVHAGIALGTQTRLGFHGAFVRVDAGQLSGKAAKQIGTAPVTGPEPGNYVNAHGAGFAVTLTTDNLAASVGATPTGFTVSNVIADIDWHIGDSPFSIGAYRHAVRDSVLSYAGLTDPNTGLVWGGVTENGGRIGIGFGQEEHYGYMNLTMAQLSGQNVEDNAKYMFGMGGMWPALTPGTSQVGVGIDFLAMGYLNNSSHFTYGQGGYFSPSRYYRPSLVVESKGRAFGQLSYDVKARLGYQAFHRASNDAFPTDADWQTASNNLRYGGDSISGVGYGFQANATWAWNRQMFLTGFIGSDNSQNYSNFDAGLIFTYSFDPQIVPPGQPLGYPAFANPWLYGLHDPRR